MIPLTASTYSDVMNFLSQLLTPLLGLTGRIAGIGTDPARTTTASLAEASAEDGAAAGEEYLLSLLRS